MENMLNVATFKKMGIINKLLATLLLPRCGLVTKKVAGGKTAIATRRWAMDNRGIRSYGFCQGGHNIFLVASTNICNRGCGKQPQKLHSAGFEG